MVCRPKSAQDITKPVLSPVMNVKLLEVTRILVSEKNKRYLEVILVITWWDSNYKIIHMVRSGPETNPPCPTAVTLHETARIRNLFPTIFCILWCVSLFPQDTKSLNTSFHTPRPSEALKYVNMSYTCIYKHFKIHRYTAIPLRAFCSRQYQMLYL